MSDYPQKDNYKLSEVCQYTDTQPYVLRFWESEFPQLSPDKRGSGVRVYRKADIDLVCRIKELLYDEEYTIAGAREVLDGESSAGRKGRRPKAAKKAQPKATKTATSSSPVQRSFDDATPEPTEATVVPIRRTAVRPQSHLESDREADVGTVSRSRYEDAVDEIDHLRLQLKDAEKGLRKTEVALDSSDEEATRHRERSQRALDRLEALVRRLDA